MPQGDYGATYHRAGLVKTALRPGRCNGLAGKLGEIFEQRPISY